MSAVRDLVAGLARGGQVLGSRLNERKDRREALAEQDRQRQMDADDALRELILGQMRQPPKTMETDQGILQWDPDAATWRPAMVGEQSLPPLARPGVMPSPMPERKPVMPYTKPSAPKEPDADPLVQVEQPDGSVVWTPRSQAAGKAAPRTEPRTPLVTAVGPDGKPVRTVDRPGLTMPSEATTEKPATDAERIAAGFADRMAQAATLLNQLESDSSFRKELTSVVRSPSGGGGVPLVGNWMLSSRGKSYKQAQENWVRANLRKESGAAIPGDEMEREIKTYFPQPGDDDQLISQKAAARQTAEANMRRNAGRAVGASITPPSQWLQQQRAGGGPPR